MRAEPAGSRATNTVPRGTLQGRHPGTTHDISLVAATYPLGGFGVVAMYMDDTGMVGLPSFRGREEPRMEKAESRTNLDAHSYGSASGP